jgi:hypothetical protein
MADTGGTYLKHSKELLSLAYIQTLCATTGLNYVSPEVDNDGIDIGIRGKGFTGHYKEPKIELQLKCTSSTDNINLETQELTYQLLRKNYNYLIGPSPVPLILVVHIAPETHNEWVQSSNLSTKIRFASYWFSLYGEKAITKGSKSIKIPLTQRLDADSLLDLMNKASEGKEIFNLEG